VRGWIDKQFLTVREPLLETILKHGYVDFGHQGFELVWGLDADGRQHIVRFKPLLPDITEILIDDHGGLTGLRQKDVDLSGTSAMLVSFGGEGSNLYGEPLLENVREAWNEWRKANEVAARYDRKIAGAYLLLHYPSFGQGIDQNGAKLDNVYLAQRILDKLEAASGVAIGDVPSELAPGQDPNQTAWRLEVQGSAGGQQQGFVDRLRYLDSLKVRGMLLPERAILEGQRGTLAESQSQSDLALLQAELVHHHLTREINRQAVDPVLEANWGPAYRGKVRLEAAPLSADNQGFLRQLVTHVLADPKDFADLFRRADWSSIFDAVGLPQTKASTVAPSGVSGPSAILSAVGQLQREALEEGEGTTSLSPSHQQRCPTTGSPTTDIAVQSQDAHTEGAAASVFGLAGFDPNQPRDKQGKWTKIGSGAASSAAKHDKDALAQAPRDYSVAGNWLGHGMNDYFDGRYSSAIQNLDRAIALDGNNAVAFYYRGLARLASGDEQGARMDFEKASALEHVWGGDVGRALERVQGPVRQLLESYRSLGERWALVSAAMSILKDSSQFKKLQEKHAPLAPDMYAWFHKVVSKLPDRSLDLLLSGGLRGIRCFPDGASMLKEMKKYPYLHAEKTPLGEYDPERREVWCYVDGEGGIRGGRVLAHELGHAIDDVGGFSRSEEWAEAWSSELKKRPIPPEEEARLWRERFGDKREDQVSDHDWAAFRFDISGREIPLTDKATVNPAEGFADFQAKVLTADPQARQELEKKFPKCMAFFRRKGILPLP
jgi:tetratricopeptide (TPR) repeat protein